MLNFFLANDVPLVANFLASYSTLLQVSQRSTTLAGRLADWQQGQEFYLRSFNSPRHDNASLPRAAPGSVCVEWDCAWSPAWYWYWSWVYSWCCLCVAVWLNCNCVWSKYWVTLPWFNWVCHRQIARLTVEVATLSTCPHAHAEVWQRRSGHFKQSPCGAADTLHLCVDSWIS